MNLFAKGSNLREPIFYGGESAYSFHFRDFSVPKDHADDPWLEKQKGFTIQDARDVIHALGKLQNEKSTSIIPTLADLNPKEWSFLPCFAFTTSELAENSGIDQSLIERVVSAFILPDEERNASFGAIDDFNVVSAMPIIAIDRDRPLLEITRSSNRFMSRRSIGCAMTSPTKTQLCSIEADLLSPLHLCVSKRFSGRGPSLPM